MTAIETEAPDLADLARVSAELEQEPASSAIKWAWETFGSWLARAGGAAAVGTTLKDLDEFPTPEEAPDYYIDFDETGPYVAEIGDSECAT